MRIKPHMLSALVAVAIMIVWFSCGYALAAEKPIGAASAIIPNANGGFSESMLGDVAADAVREAAGSQIAIVFSGDLGSYLPSGDIFAADIESSFPLDSIYYVLDITPADLKSILEYGAGELFLTEEETLDTKRSESDVFPQAAGFSYRIDASAPVGERILSVVMPGGEALDLASTERTLTAALPEKALALTDQTDAAMLGGIREVFTGYLQKVSPLERPRLERIRILGAHTDPLLGSGPVILIGIVILICVVMAIPSMLQKKKNPEAREEMYLPGLIRLRNK